MLAVLDQNQIEHVLRTERIGRIASHADGRSYVVRSATRTTGAAFTPTRPKG